MQRCRQRKTNGDIVLPGIAIFSLLAALLFPAQGGATEHQQGQGRVNMQGSIIETACAIDTESQDQSIEMKTLPVSQLVRDGIGNSQPFSIRLINCNLDTETAWRQLRMVFDGQADGELFGVSGEAKGIGIQLINSSGVVARPGEPLPAEDINPGEMRLHYALRVAGNQQLLSAGEYYSAIRFKLEYY